MPVTAEKFIEIFENYNEFVFPLKAVLNFGIYEDFGLLAVAVVGTFFIIRRYFTLQKERWL